MLNCLNRSFLNLMGVCFFNTCVTFGAENSGFCGGLCVSRWIPSARLSARRHLTPGPGRLSIPPFGVRRRPAPGGLGLALRVGAGGEARRKPSLPLPTPFLPLSLGSAEGSIATEGRCGGEGGWQGRGVPEAG